MYKWFRCYNSVCYFALLNAAAYKLRALQEAVLSLTFAVSPISAHDSKFPAFPFGARVYSCVYSWGLGIQFPFPPHTAYNCVSTMYLPCRIKNDYLPPQSNELYFGRSLKVYKNIFQGRNYTKIVLQCGNTRNEKDFGFPRRESNPDPKEFLVGVRTLYPNR